MQLCFVAFGLLALTLAAYLTLTHPLERDDLDNEQSALHTSAHE